MNAELQINEPSEPAHIESQTTTALAVVTQSITEINAFEAGITELERQYKGVVFEVSTTAGMDEACKARLAIRKPRYAIQKLAKEAKATLNNLKSGIDEQAEGYITRIGAVEDPVHEQIENEIKRKAAEKQAKAEAERKRIAVIEERINNMRESVALLAGRTAADIAIGIGDIESVVIDHTFAEFQQRAETAKAATLVRLKLMHDATLRVETEQARLIEERAELARQRAAEKVRLAQERERLAEEQRQARKASEAEAARQAEVLRRQKVEQEAEAARVRAEQEAAAATERARIEEENRQARLKREAEESAHQERLRRQREEDERAAAERLRVLAEQEALFVAQKAAQEAHESIQREAREAEESLLAEQRAELERQQEALRLAQEAVTKPTDPVEATAAEDVQPSTTSVRAEAPERPSDEEIIEVVTRAFFVSEDVAWEWIAGMDVERRKAA